MAIRRLPRFLLDPFSRSMVFAAALVVGGLVGIGLGWRGVARSVLVPEQLSFLVSGGLGGLALVITGSGIAMVQCSRYWSARERRNLDSVLASAARTLDAQALGSGSSRVSAPPR
jgi:hypothetical protein